MCELAGLLPISPPNFLRQERLDSTLIGRRPPSRLLPQDSDHFRAHVTAESDVIVTFLVDHISLVLASHEVLSKDTVSISFCHTAEIHKFLEERATRR